VLSDDIYDVLNDAVLEVLDDGMIDRGAYDAYYQPLYFVRWTNLLTRWNCIRCHFASTGGQPTLCAISGLMQCSIPEFKSPFLSSGQRSQRS